MKTKMYRQGDVLIAKTNETVRGKDASEKGRIILAHGEVTGHAHEVISDEPVTLTEIGDGSDSIAGARLLHVAGRAVVRHQEHAEIPLKRGTYRVIRQREYSPESIRNVAD